MQKRIVAGNWKMHGSRQQAESLVNAIKLGAHFPNVDIRVFPSFVHLQQTQQQLTDSTVTWGAQNLYLGESGAFTGEVSAPMLRDYGCQSVLIGHSERRQIFHEDLKLVAAKLKAALQFQLQPILCCGETLTEREKNLTETVLRNQLESALQGISSQDLPSIVIAYEPIWAIGTGLTATPEQAQNVHIFIRNCFAQYDIPLAKSLRILYGGSVKADNAAGLFAMPDIDGALVGGASLDAKSFLAICQQASQ